MQRVVEIKIVNQKFDKPLDKSQRGDTLIEVLVAIAILSLAVVLAQSIMNHGQSIALRSVERTSAQSMMNSQLSYIRYARDEFMVDETSAGGHMWQKIIDSSGFVLPETTHPPVADYCLSDPARPASEQKMFYIEETIALADTTDTAPKFAAALRPYPLGGAASTPLAASATPVAGRGIWLVARSGGDKSNKTDYIDFYVRGCWGSLVNAPYERTSFVMRLYANK